MGGNTYNRKWFSDEQLTELVSKIDGFKSLFDERVFNDLKQWRANISRHLDNDSCNRFYFMIEKLNGLPACAACKITLGIESFQYRGARHDRGFLKYCPTCMKSNVWKLSENIDPVVRKARGEKITQSKLAFYQTAQGKETARIIGKKNSVALTEFFKTPEGMLSRQKISEQHSVVMRQKILEGTFTPNSNNRNTHWSSIYNGNKYRSSWEALYQYFNPTAEYEKLRISYPFQGKSRVYIVDFIDYVNKVVVEVKPEELLSDEKTIAKLAALSAWAKSNNFEITIFTAKVISTLPEPDYTLFDKSTADRIKKLYASFKN